MYDDYTEPLVDQPTPAMTYVVYFLVYGRHVIRWAIVVGLGLSIGYSVWAEWLQ